MAFTTFQTHDVSVIYASSQPHIPCFSIKINGNGAYSELEIDLFPTPESAEKFARLAAAINEIFGEEAPEPAVQAMVECDLPF